MSIEIEVPKGEHCSNCVVMHFITDTDGRWIGFCGYYGKTLLIIGDRATKCRLCKHEVNL